MGDGKGIIPTAGTSGVSPRRSKKRNQVDQLVTLTKIQQAVDLRKQEASYLQIGSKLNCSTTYAFKLVRRGIVTLAGEAGESAKTVKALIVARMDAMTHIMWTMLEGQSKGPDGLPVEPDIRTALSIIDRLGRIDDRRAKLEGLIGGVTTNAAVQIKVDMRRSAAKQLDPLMTNMTLDEKVVMLELIEKAEARAAAVSAAPVIIDMGSKIKPRPGHRRPPEADSSFHPRRCGAESKRRQGRPEKPSPAVEICPRGARGRGQAGVGPSEGLGAAESTPGPSLIGSAMRAECRWPRPRAGSPRSRLCPEEAPEEGRRGKLGEQ